MEGNTEGIAEEVVDVAPAPAPIPLVRARTDGGIPLYRGTDVTVTSMPEKNFDGLIPAVDRVWFGPTTFTVNGDEWTIDEFLNFGAEGQTYAVTEKETGNKYAAKFCNDVNSLEITLLQSLPQALVSHPNFLTYLMIVLDVEAAFPYAKHIIFMEHVPNGELFDFIASAEPSVAGQPVSEGTCRRFLQDVICGMAECYRYGVAHRDLKPENLLINEEGRIIIIDMGHAKRAATTVVNRTDAAAPPLIRATTTNRYGTEAFNAPEAVTGENYDCQLSDMWAIGVIAFMLHAKLPPFVQGGGVGQWTDIVGPNNEQFWRRIESSGYYPTYPDSLKSFINSFWRREPTERPTFGQLELAVGGHEDTIAAFPGLSWLAKPVNDVDAFMSELRRTSPLKTFRPPDGSCSRAARW